jgi:hypothetical protein
MLSVKTERTRRSGIISIQRFRKFRIQSNSVIPLEHTFHTAMAARVNFSVIIKHAYVIVYSETLLFKTREGERKRETNKNNAFVKFSKFPSRPSFSARQRARV